MCRAYNDIRTKASGREGGPWYWLKSIISDTDLLWAISEQAPAPEHTATWKSANPRWEAVNNKQDEVF